MKLSLRSFVFVMLIGLSGTLVRAEEAAAPAQDTAAQKAAMMEKMKAMTSPGAAHKVLEPLAGKWTYASKFWMNAEGPAEESTGSSDNELVFGGRFLKETVKGTWNGEPFEGVGYTGYDNIKAEYESNWIDGAATGIMNSSGQYDAATNTLKLSGTASCPLTGEKNRQMRMENAITDNDHHTFSSYGMGPDGKEFKMMEIVYTRAA